MENNQTLSIVCKPKRKPRRHHFTIKDKLKESPSMEYKYFNGYTVFSDGAIFNPWGWLLTVQTQRSGSPRYSFKLNKKQISISAASIVAELFVPNPNKFEHIGFKDGNVCNFNASNLQWIDQESYRRISSPTKLTIKEKIQSIVDAEKIKDPSLMVAEFEGYTVLSNGMIINKVAKLVNDYNSKHKKGLCGVTLNLKKHQLKILVATLFVANPTNYTHVEQLNGNTKDCHYKNLRWVPEPSYIETVRHNLSGPEKQEETIKIILCENPSLQYKKFGNYVVFDNGTFVGYNGKILKPSLYQRRNAKVINHEMPLAHNGKQRCWRTCMIVATLFIPNPDQHQYVAFKDGNLMNVSASNLYWTSFKKPVPTKEMDDTRKKDVLSKLTRHKLSDADIAIYDFLNGNEAAIITFLYPHRDAFCGWIVNRGGVNSDNIARISWDRAHDLFFEAMERVEEFIRKGKLLPAYGKPIERLYSYIYFELMQRMGKGWSRHKLEFSAGNYIQKL